MANVKAKKDVVDMELASIMVLQEHTDESTPKDQRRDWYRKIDKAVIDILTALKMKRTDEKMA